MKCIEVLHPAIVAKCPNLGPPSIIDLIIVNFNFNLRYKRIEKPGQEIDLDDNYC